LSTHEVPLLLDGPCGALEARYLDLPNARGLALLCHPNPAQGGTMLNKVISTLQRSARDAGLATLRFNYRGVGLSAGEHDVGRGEVDDAEAVVTWLRAQHPDLPLSVLGFSFGGFVATALAARQEAQGLELEQLLLVAPAVARLGGHDALPQRCRLTLIQPEADDVLDPDAVFAWSASLGRAHELLKVAECGHFFHGKLGELKALVLPRL
jgi:alpha/beta superfamily hydrolase